MASTWVVWSLCVVLSQFVLPISGQGCGTDLSTKVTSFATGSLECQPYSLGSANNQLYIWALNDNATKVTSMVVAVPLTPGNWAGIGFSREGLMVGSTALIATFNTTTTARATVYSLNGQTPSQVVPGNGLSFVGGSAEAIYDGTSKYVYMSYQVDFNKSTPANPAFLLMAYGVLSTTGTLETDTYYAAPTPAKFLTGVVAGPSAVDKLNKKAKIHGWLNILGWGLLLPIGAMVARYAHHFFDPCWFYTHIAFQIVGFGCVIAGVTTGVELAKDKQPQQLDAHRGLGIFIFVLAILQILAVVVRPKNDAKVHKYWNWYHHWVGRLALFLALINIFVGLHMSPPEHDFKVGYISILSIELGAFAILEILLWLRWNRQRPRPCQETSSQEDPTFQFGGSV